MTNEQAHATLQSIGWFDGLVFTAPLNDKLRPLLDRAAEKYGCDGAELLEKMAVDCLGVSDKKGAWNEENANR